MSFLRLLPYPVSNETERIVEQLLLDVREGTFGGVALVAIGPKWSYVGHVAGLARENPTFTLGALWTLGQNIQALRHDH